MQATIRALKIFFFPGRWRKSSTEECTEDDRNTAQAGEAGWKEEHEEEGRQETSDEEQEHHGGDEDVAGEGTAGEGGEE